MCQSTSPRAYISLLLVCFINLIFINYQSKLDKNILFLLGVQNLVHYINVSVIYLCILYRVGYYRVLPRPLLVFHRYFVIIYFICISTCLLTLIS